MRVVLDNLKNLIKEITGKSVREDNSIKKPFQTDTEILIPIKYPNHCAIHELSHWLVTDKADRGGNLVFDDYRTNFGSKHIINEIAAIHLHNEIYKPIHNETSKAVFDKVLDPAIWYDDIKEYTEAICIFEKVKKDEEANLNKILNFILTEKNLIGTKKDNDVLHSVFT